MKKLVTVLALAVATSAVLAQSAPQVSVYGKARMYEESYKLGTADSLTRLTNDTSRFGIKASEGVGNGITISGVIETGAISLLSNYERTAIDAPSTTWLGKQARSELVKKSGLWNVNHVKDSSSDRFIDTLEKYIHLSATS